MGPPRFIAPMLVGSRPDLALEGLDPARWALELKLDGWRAQLRVRAGAVELRTRSGRRLPHELAPLDTAALDNLILDGELVCLDAHGRGCFTTLVRTVGAPDGQAAFSAFDILWHEGTLLTDRPLDERRQRLEDLPLRPAGVALVPRLELNDDLLDDLAACGHEGVVAKRRDGVYRPGKRSPTWIKRKAWRTTRATALELVDGAHGARAVLADGPAATALATAHAATLRHSAPRHATVAGHGPRGDRDLHVRAVH